MYEQALKYRAMGYCPIALRENAKQPDGSWLEFQNRMPTHGELISKFGVMARHNIGIVCGAISGGLYVRDFDDLDKGREFFRKHRALIKTLVRTRKGIHAYFRASARNSQGEKEDGRGEGGYVVVPPSIVEGHKYEFIEGYGLVPPDELCELPEELVHGKGQLQPTIHLPNDRLESISRAMEYAENTPAAVSGQRGHVQLLKFCSRMVWQPPKGFGLTVSEAWPIAQIYNRRCQPEWKDRDIARKFNEALKNEKQ